MNEAPTDAIAVTSRSVDVVAASGEVKWPHRGAEVAAGGEI